MTRTERACHHSCYDSVWVLDRTLVKLRLKEGFTPSCFIKINNLLAESPSEKTNIMNTKSNISKITTVLATFLIIFTSCSSPEQQVAERTCSCVEPLITFTQDTTVTSLDKWYNSLDYTTKSTISYMGSIPEGVDKVKAQKFMEYKKKENTLSKESESCMNAIKDEFGEDIKNEEFAKKMRIHLREICPDAAQKLGI
jgi:hypothetical protein